MPDRQKWIFAAGIAAVGIAAACYWFRSSETRDGGKNIALLFIKPHGKVEGVANLIEKELAAAGMKITNKGQLPGKIIEENGTIDAHYAAIGAYAMTLSAEDLPVSDEKKKEFEIKFAESYESAVASGRILNVAGFQAKFGLSGSEIGAEFEAAKGAKGAKLAPGCYVAYIAHRRTYLVNGFYANMREEFVNRKAVVSWMVVSWPQKHLSWKDFRANVLGATDPSVAAASSIRAKILKKYKDLKLPFKPNTGRNCIHGSASPLEALNERRIWIGTKTANDPFGAALLDAGITQQQITAMCANPTIDGVPLFDLVEDTDTDKCVALLKQYSARL